MVEKFDKIVKFFTILKDYYILRKEKEHLIVGTKITIFEHKVFEMVFTTRADDIPKDLNVFFLITTTEESKDLDKFFEKRGLPLLSPKSADLRSLKSFKKTLDKFVDNNFYY